MDEFYGYMGILPIFLFILSAHARPWKKVLFYQLLALGSLLLVLANGLPPLFCRAYAHIPGFNVFRISSRFLLLFNFSLAAMVGFGLDWVKEKMQSPAKVKINPVVWLLWTGLVIEVFLLNRGSVQWNNVSGNLKSIPGSQLFVLTLITRGPGHTRFGNQTTAKTLRIFSAHFYPRRRRTLLFQQTVRVEARLPGELLST